MSYDELYKWMEYYNKEPFSADRQELQMANLSSIVVNLVGKSKLGTKDFMICKKEEKKQTVKEFEDDLKNRFAMFAKRK